MSTKDVKKLGTSESRIRYDDNSFSRGVHQTSDSGEASKGFFQDIALGLEPNFSSEFKFGENPDLGTSEEVIWHAGGNYDFLPYGVAEQMSIVSDSALDTNGGVGAWDVVVLGLDIDGFLQSELVLLSGLVPVLTTKSFFRINRCIVLHSGTATAVNDANQGEIDVNANVSGNLLARLGIHDGQTTQAVYTVPKGKTGYATGISFNIGQGKECRFTAKFRNCIDNDCAFTTKYSLTVYENTVFGDLKIPLKVPELTDIVMVGQLGSTPNVRAHASFGLFLKDNEV